MAAQPVPSAATPATTSTAPAILRTGTFSRPAIAAPAAAVCGPERLHAELRPSAVLAGCGGFRAYVLVLAALRLAPAAPVSAVRETSVLFAVALAAPLLGERVTRTRLAGAALVVAGVVALGTG